MFITGVTYADPEEGTGEVYVPHCGSTYSFNNEAYDVPNFIVKVRPSQDILRRLGEHQANNSPLHEGEVEFQFEVELKDRDRVNAVSEQKSKLTELGLSHTVFNGGGRTTETFKFYEMSHTDDP
ncbi:hypothetical protein P3T76_012286 [Phytophthora citrophthora]|uniref:Uncharacterized protein n=1 Tax=Phytophthora citrophthora TaxID=4793 RepID=A0AAD9G5R4_9STRA|nr:hypothetical protein P3T76_012286 [Phytophthora citrophthora]